MFQHLVLSSVFNMTGTYNFTSPVYDPDLFLGRRALVSKIYARIGAGRPQSVSIVGDAKIGKSSLLHYLLHERIKGQMLTHPDDYIFLYIPCRTDNQLTLNTFTSTIFRMTREYSENSNNANIQIEYNYFKHLVENLHKQNKKIILFLDDFNLITLNPAFPLEFFSFLRSLANNFNLAYITTSYEDLQKLCVSKDIEESPFFNIFTNMSLRGFEAAEIDPLFQNSIGGGSIDIKEEKDYLTELVGMGPYPLQMACHFLHLIKKESGSFDLNVKEQFETILTDNLNAYHQALWEHMDESYHSILFKLAYGRQIPSSQQYLLRDLSKKSYILNSNGGSQISSVLFKNFIRQMSGQQNDLDLQEMKVRRFFSRIKQIISNFKN